MMPSDRSGITNNQPIIGVVGPCGSGKTTLTNELIKLGVYARHIAQEHSYVPTMWQRITNPDILIFLDASYPETIRRRGLDWNIEEYNEQQRRLEHARQHCDLYLFTDPLTPERVIHSVVDFLRNQGLPINSPDNSG